MQVNQLGTSVPAACDLGCNCFVRRYTYVVLLGKNASCKLDEVPLFADASSRTQLLARAYIDRNLGRYL